jgi:hypothetical protein
MGKRDISRISHIRCRVASSGNLVSALTHHRCAANGPLAKMSVGQRDVPSLDATLQTRRLSATPLLRNGTHPAGFDARMLHVTVFLTVQIDGEPVNSLAETGPLALFVSP